MLIPKKCKIAVYSYLFKEGVMVAHKDYNMRKHKDVDVPNLYVIKLMQSMVSRGYVKEQFSWQWYYWYLTNEGIEFLREDLGLPQEIVPTTLKKPRGSATQQGERGDRRERGEGRERFPRGERGDREGRDFRRGGDNDSQSQGSEGFGRPRGGDDKKSDSAAPGYQPTFNRDTDRGSRGGFGGERRQGGGLGRGGGFSRDNRSQGSSGYRRDSPSGDRQQRPSGASGAGAAAPRQDS
eukprot:TRINITY_DN22789_c0_g1_i1.p1 TRINITY_DN22789_c0_g1~~TRINITY_DN22789_c0_g1_i1.p1  ORF type:complete len:237 (-),score=79.47 TRINITY_DN22789_c0_g1_i1:70-780(-)